MPFTPFHFGPAILLGLLLLKKLDFPTFVAANVAVDWRAFLVFFGFWPEPLHSWQHSYLGATVLSIALGSVMLYLRPYIEVLMQEFMIEQSFSPKSIFLAAFSGTFLHVTLDAFHHPSMQTFLPLDMRPLFGLLSTSEVRALTFSMMFLSIPVYIYVGLKSSKYSGADSLSEMFSRGTA